MSDEFGYLKPTVDLLTKEATANQQQLHKSFVLRLENYTLRRGTRSLSDETKKKIVEEVGREAIEKAREQRGAGTLGGVDVEVALKGRCPHAWLLCYETARKVVETYGLPGEQEIMNQLDLEDF